MWFLAKKWLMQTKTGVIPKSKIKPRSQFNISYGTVIRKHEVIKDFVLSSKSKYPMIFKLQKWVFLWT